MLKSWTLSSLLFYFIELSLAFNCSVPPVYVEIRRREVSGSSDLQYGSYAGIGIPPQNQSIWPSLSQNETSFAHKDFCEHSSLRLCNNRTGGFVDPSQSTSWTETFSNDTSTGNETAFIAGTDTLRLFSRYPGTDIESEILIQNMSVQLHTGGDRNPGILGIGSSSTLLQKLYDLGRIGGKTYSLFVGTNFERAGGVVGGSNMFGGYDATRFKGRVHTYPMDLSATDYLPVTVTDIILDHPTNPLHERISIVGDYPFEARITSDRYAMVFPSIITSRFTSAVQAAPAQRDDEPGKALRLTAPFNGTMTIVLEGGFNVTLPPEIISNPSSLSAVASAQLPNYTGPYYLSTAFLTQVYLMLDFSAQTFHLAQAVSSPSGSSPIAQPFCPGTVPVAVRTRRRNMWFQTHIGAVIGAIVGGAGLLLFLLTVCFVRKRRQLARQQRVWAQKKAALAAAAARDAAEGQQQQMKTVPNVNRGMEMGRVSNERSTTMVATSLVPPPKKVRFPVVVAGAGGGEDLVLGRSHSPPAMRSRSVSPISSVSRYSTDSNDFEYIRARIMDRRVQ